MKKEMRVLAGLFLVLFIIGSVSAVWWNPFSWEEKEISKNVVLDESYLIGYYEFDGNALDSSARKNNLKGQEVNIHNDAVRGKVAHFGGNNSYLYSSSEDFEIGEKDFEISFWAKDLKLEQNDVVIGKGNENDKTEGYRILGNTNIGYYLRVSDGTNRIRSEGIKVNDSEWHEFTYVFERNKNDGIRAYLDGVQVGVSYPTKSIVSNIDAKESQFVIGRNSEASDGYIRGLLDEVRIYLAGVGENSDESSDEIISSSKTYCNSSWNCKIGENCNLGICGPIKTCTESQECPSGQNCNKKTLMCQEIECSGISYECISSPFKVCDNGLCVEKECFTSNDCPKNTKCSEGICFKPMCEKDFEKCGSRNLGVCYNKICFTKWCSVNSDCSYDKVCNNGLCFAKDCNSEAECNSTEHCSNNICVEDECIFDSNCNTKGSDFYCFEGFCVLPQCNSDANCPVGRTCVQRQCVIGEICDDNIDNDKNGLTDYADEKCKEKCLSPKKITFKEPGKGVGAPTLIIENKSSAGCCLKNQCYLGGICMSDGAVINVHQGQKSEMSYCKVNGSSAVFCRQSYVNDGNGNCIKGSTQPTPTLQDECVNDLDCPSIQCAKAPCPINKCVSGKCVLSNSTTTKIYCNIFKRCPKNMECTSKLIGVCV